MLRLPYVKATIKPMTKPTVYFTDLRADTKRTLFDKLDELIGRLNLEGRFRRGHLVAVKLHFGEKGNTAYIRPQFVRRVVDRIKDTGARPFLTDTNTLYVGQRTNTVAHMHCAIGNGFDFATINAPIVIADGLRGENRVMVEVNGTHCREVSIAREIVSADGLVVLTHFKCHELTGFGGAIKNVGMGCASREGKLMQHSGTAPIVKAEGCTACGDCALICPVDAIDIGNVAVIDEKVCIGCSHCIAACPEGTIDVQWSANAAAVQEKMVEHMQGVLKGKVGKTVYISFITQVSPACDCYGHTDAPIVPDIGIVASLDPVAIDQACVDLVNKAKGFKDTRLETGHESGGDKFRGVYPEIDWTVQLECGEKAGLGKRDYTLTDISEEGPV